ncbi:MAG: ABC transporter ATP-binding protein [Acetobacteraceae bacterium]
MSGLELTDVRLRLGRNEILRGVDLAVAAGETLVLFGPSGVGKTMLLRAIAGVEPAASGSVRIGGQEVGGLDPEHRPLGMAFQNFALYPHFPAFENIASPLRARGLGESEIAARVDKVATLLRIGHVLGHMPKELSNGQKQRTALARALVAEPPVLLLDDPLRNVDAKLRYEMRLELPPLLRRTRAAVIFVTQDFREAMALGDRVAVLREGAIEQQAPPDVLYAAPASVPIARLFGDPPMNLLSARQDAEGIAAVGMHFAFPDLKIVPDKALLGIRPEDILLARSGAAGRVPAEVMAVTPLHERLVVLLRVAGVEIVASTPASAMPPGGDVHLAGARRALLFDGVSGRLQTASAEAELVA